MSTQQQPIPPLTVREISSSLSITDDVARYLLRTKKIRGFKVGGRWRIPAEALTEYMIAQLSKP